MKSQQESELGAGKGLQQGFDAQTAGGSRTEAELRSECDALRQALKHLEEEYIKLQEECDSYRRLAYAWALEKLPKDVSIDEAEDWQPLEKFLPELERSLRGS